jgi:L-amino acid N-acyltransferase YncA
MSVRTDLTARTATPEDAAAIARIYNQGIEGRTAAQREERSLLAAAVNGRDDFRAHPHVRAALTRSADGG